MEKVTLGAKLRRGFVGIFTCKWLRNLLSIVMLAVATMTMFFIDSYNSVRLNYLTFLENDGIKNFAASIGLEKTDIGKESWIIFAAIIVLFGILLLGNIFDSLIVGALAKNFDRPKKAKKVLMTIYYILLLGVVALAVELCYNLITINGKTLADYFIVDNINAAQPVVMILAAIAAVIAILLAIFVVYALIVSVAHLFTGKKPAEAVEPAEEKAEDTAPVEEAAEEAAPAEEKAEEAEPVEETAKEAAPAEEKAEEVAPVEETAEEAAPAEEKAEDTAPVEEAAEEAAPAEEKVEEPVKKPAKAPIVVADGENVRINRSFIGKLHQADDHNKAYYAEIKNHILSYKKVVSRVSWNFDSFNVGRFKKVKIALKGKTLELYLALDPKKYENTKYFCKNVGTVKKYEEVPMLFKVKSARGVKFAKELIDILFANYEKKSKFTPVDYTFEYMSDATLIKEELAKYVSSKF